MVSFFTYNDFLGTQIRALQIAEYLGARVNPPDHEGACIHVKPTNLENVFDGEWVDISDSPFVAEMLKTKPKVNAIAHSQHIYNILEIPNKKVWLSQQHLNWERDKRDRKEITTCGYIGGPSQHTKDFFARVGKAFEDAGFKFISCFDYGNVRERAVNFYKSIDILVIENEKRESDYKTPTKMINAASFGVPSIARPLPGYLEWEGNYIKANSLEEMISEAKKLKDNYESWVDKLIDAAEFYHISNVAKRYEDTIRVVDSM